MKPIIVSEEISWKLIVMWTCLSCHRCHRKLRKLPDLSLVTEFKFSNNYLRCLFIISARMTQTLPWTGHFLNYCRPYFSPPCEDVRTISATTCLNSKASKISSYSRHHIQGHSCSIPPLGELAEASIFDGMSHLENYDLYMGSWTNPHPPPMCAYFPSINGEQNVLFSSSVWSFYFHVSEAEWCMSICCASSCGDANFMHMHTLIGVSLTESDIDRRSNTIEKKSRITRQAYFWCGSVRVVSILFLVLIVNS